MSQPPWDAPGYLEGRRDFIARMTDWFDQGVMHEYLDQSGKYSTDLDLEFLISESPAMQREHCSIKTWLLEQVRLQGFRLVRWEQASEYDDGGNGATADRYVDPETGEEVETGPNDFCLGGDGIYEAIDAIRSAIEEEGEDPGDVAAAWLADLRVGGLMRTPGEERAMSALNESDLGRFDYVMQILDFYETDEEAAVAICDVIRGVERAKDAVIADREDAIRHLAAHP